VLSELPARKARPQARSASRTGDHEHRQPSRSFMPTRRVAGGLVAGSAGFDARESRQRERCTVLSLRRQSGGPSGRSQRETGLARPPDRSLTTKSQTNEVWSVSPACLRAQRRKAGRSHGYGFGVVLGDMRSIAPMMLLPWPGEASRPLKSSPSGATELFLTVLPVCGRRNERSGSLLHL
jgi:hypothetical protein